MTDNTAAAPQGDSPRSAGAPPRPTTDSNLVKYAWDELDRAGLFDRDSDYEGMVGAAVLELVEVFAAQGHSGTSAAMTLDMFRLLASFQPLSPLTDDPAEWVEVADGLWQSSRQGAAFSHDGGKTYSWNSDPGALLTSAPGGQP